MHFAIHLILLNNCSTKINIELNLYKYTEITVYQYTEIKR